MSGFCLCLFCFCIVYLDLYHFPESFSPSLSTFILSSVLFCPPWGVKVMPLKTNIPGLHLLLFSLKETRKKESFNNNVRSSAVWGTRVTDSAKRRSDEKTKMELIEGIRKIWEWEAGRQLWSHSGFRTICFMKQNYLHAFPQGLLCSCVCLQRQKLLVCVSPVLSSWFVTNINLIFLKGLMQNNTLLILNVWFKASPGVNLIGNTPVTST